MQVITPLIGGALIGASASALLLLNGKVAGISGMVGGLVARQRGEVLWRALFLAGLVAGGAAVSMTMPDAVARTPLVSLPIVAIAGLLVGWGTRVSRGCTSGHGVCGMSRFSRRSIVATLTFMAFGMLTVFVWRHVIGVGS